MTDASRVIERVRQTDELDEVESDPEAWVVERKRHHEEPSRLDRLRELIAERFTFEFGLTAARRGRDHLVRVPAARPDLGRQHSRGRRHGRPRVGSGLPPRRAVATRPPLGMDARLVRGLPRLPVLHGGAVAADRVPRPLPAVRGGVQGRRRGRTAGHAGRLCDLRLVGRVQAPHPGPLRSGRGVVPLRHLLHHLRRESRVDDGRRVRVFPGVADRHRLPRRGVARVPHRPAPGPGRRPARPDRAVPHHPRVLRPRRHGGVLALPAPRGRAMVRVEGQQPLVAGHHGIGGRPALRVLGGALRRPTGLRQRHGVGTDHAVRREPLPRRSALVGPARRRRSRRGLLSAPPGRNGHRGARRRRGGRLPVHPRRAPLERPHPALLPPGAVLPGRSRGGRRAAARGPVGDPERRPAVPGRR